MIESWDCSDATEWLSPVDVLVALGIVAIVAGEHSAIEILEIGAWKGGWSNALARNARKARITAIDPYPGAPEVRTRFLADIERFGLGSRVALFDDWDQVESARGSNHSGFSLIHVDGEHTETAVASDLLRATESLSAGGVIVVDDIRHLYLPGVASATYEFIYSSGFSIFLMTKDKAYLCRDDDHARWYAKIECWLESTPLVWERFFGEKSDHQPVYIEEPRVRGRLVMLCVDPRNPELALSGAAVAVGHSPLELSEVPDANAQDAGDPTQTASRFWFRRGR